MWVKGADDVDAELVIATEEAVIQFTRIGVVLLVFGIADLAIFDHHVEDHAL